MNFEQKNIVMSQNLRMITDKMDDLSPMSKWDENNEIVATRFDFLYNSSWS